MSLKLRGFSIPLALLAVLIVAIISFVYLLRSNVIEIASYPTGIPAEKVQFPPYKAPQIPKNNSYRIVIVGDSIVAALGPNANSLRLELINKYPESEFVIYNYGYPATSLLSLTDRLNKETTDQGSKYLPILEQGYELMVLESFANNPLSQFPIEEGLAKQTQILKESVTMMVNKKPDAAIVFLTPIAFDEQNFVKGLFDLSDEQRAQWIKERIEYVKNHKKFAQDHGIPIIDVYELSKGEDGKVIKEYVSADNIHPSSKGVELISRSVAEYIFQNRIFPE